MLLHLLSIQIQHQNVRRFGSLNYNSTPETTTGLLPSLPPQFQSRQPPPVRMGMSAWRAMEVLSENTS